MLRPFIQYGRMTNFYDGAFFLFFYFFYFYDGALSEGHEAMFLRFS